MSVHITSLVYRARLGNAARKAVALKLADCADDEGRNVFPSVERVAREAEVSVRTVQRTLSEFKKTEILIVEREGGRGRRHTTKYRFDIDRLLQLASGKWELRKVAGRVMLVATERASESKGDSLTPLAASKGDSVASLKGDNLAPLETARVTGATSKGDTDDALGCHGDTRTIKNYQDPPPSGAHDARRAAGAQGSEREEDTTQVKADETPALTTASVALPKSHRPWLEQLVCDGVHLDIVEHFITPLIERLGLPPSAVSPVALLRDLRDRAAAQRPRLTPKALRKAAAELRHGRAKLPVRAEEIDAPLKAARVACTIIVEAGDPRWEAWLVRWTQDPTDMLISAPSIFRRTRNPFGIDADWPPDSPEVDEMPGPDGSYRYSIPWGTAEHAAWLCAMRRAGKAHLGTHVDEPIALHRTSRWPALDGGGNRDRQTTGDSTSRSEV